MMHQDDPLAKKDVIYPNDLAERFIASITGQHTVKRQLDAYLAKAGVTVERYISSYFLPSHVTSLRLETRSLLLTQQMAKPI